MIRPILSLRLLTILLLLPVAASCGRKSSPEERTPFDPETARKAFAGVTYRRSGGLAGGQDTITVAPDGTLTTAGRLFGRRRGQLTDFQILQLVRLLEGWPKLAAEYPAPPGTADAFIVEIEHAGKKVTATDASPGVPESFRLVRDRLETLAQAAKPQ